MLRKYILIVGLIFLSFGCVYKINIAQGNLVSDDMLNQLKTGLTKQQVQFIMGNPLIKDSWQSNRWDYIQSNIDARGKRTQKRVSLFFDEHNKLKIIQRDLPLNSSKNNDLTDAKL